MGSVTIGRNSLTGQDISVDPRTSLHCAVQGATRSGKSSLAYTWLGGLAPDVDAGRVILCGVDPSGLLLGPWAAYRGASLRVIGTGQPTAYVDVLGQIVAEMDRRISRLHRAGLDQWPLSASTVLVVIEELPAVGPLLDADDAAEGRKPADKLGKQWTALLGRLLAEGAKAGVRLLLIAQRFAVGEGLRGTDRGNIGTRITLRVSDRASVAFLHEGIDATTATSVAGFRAGQALIERPGEPLTTMLADYTTYAQYRDRLSRVRGEDTTDRREGVSAQRTAQRSGAGSGAGGGDSATSATCVAGGLNTRRPAPMPGASVVASTVAGGRS